MSRRHARRYGWLATTTMALVASAGASAATTRDAALDPGQRVNGMQVVQGVKREADGWLFDSVCDPVVLKPGRRTRVCGQLPPMRRIFIGYEIFAPREQIDDAWKKTAWSLWIDGRRVSLGRFGYADRMLLGFAPAGGRDVVLREWAIILRGAEGRHAIRYRTRSSGAVSDTTWRFVVASS